MRTVTEISVTNEPIRVDTSGHHVGDPKWVHVDSHSHEHRFDGDALETLKWVVTGSYWCDLCSDVHQEGEYRCRECSDVVEPHWNHTGPLTVWIPGLREVVFTMRDEGVVGTYWLRHDESDAFMAAEDRTAKAQEIVSARDPDVFEYRDPAWAGP